MQCVDGITSINKTILDDGIASGAIEVREDLKIAYKSQEPIYKALSYTFNPALRGISGDEEGSMAFFERVGISYGIKFEELGNEEKDLLKEELIKINPKIFGEVYSIPNEIPELRNIEDYSKVLDACGKNKKHGVGLSICIGDRESSVKEAETLLKTYRENLMDWLCCRRASLQMLF